LAGGLRRLLARSDLPIPSWGTITLASTGTVAYFHDGRPPVVPAIRTASARALEPAPEFSLADRRGNLLKTDRLMPEEFRPPADGPRRLTHRPRYNLSQRV
jgi:hypothetical protein